MRLPQRLIACALLALLTVGNGAAQPQEGTWPNYRGDLAHTGLAKADIGPSAELVWRFETRGDIFSTVAVTNGSIFVASVDDHLYSLAHDGELQWYQALSGSIQGTPTYDDERVYAVTRDVRTAHGDIYAFARESGDHVWSIGAHGDVLASPQITAEGLLIVEGARLVMREPATGQLRWAYEFAARLHSTPAVHDGQVFAGARSGDFVILDLGTGMPIHGFRGNEFFAAPAVKAGTLFVADRAGFITAYGLADQDIRWQGDVGRSIESSPAIVGGVVVVADIGGNLRALSASDGSERWHQQIGRVGHSSITSDGITGVVGSANGQVYAFSMSSGRITWTYDAGSGIEASVVPVGTRLLVGDRDGFLHALETSASGDLGEPRLLTAPPPKEAIPVAIIDRPNSDRQAEGEAASVAPIFLSLTLIAWAARTRRPDVDGADGGTGAS